MNRSLKHVSPLEKVDFENEEVSDQVPTELLDELSGGRGRATCRMLS